MTKTRIIFKIIILSLLGAFLISFIEQYYYEEVFYKPVIKKLEFAKYARLNNYFSTINPTIPLNLICPTNFEIRIYHSLTRDSTKSNPSYNIWNRIEETKYAEFPEEFVNVDNETELQKKIQQIDKEIETCNFLINVSKKSRMLTLITSSALQPFHLILGWILSKILLKIGKFFVIILYLYILIPLFSLLKHIGYFFRGIYRGLAKIFKDYEDLGK